MKKLSFILVVAVLFSVRSFAKTTPSRSEPSRTELKQNPGISFTENKGQVHDQNYKPRPDVLYGVMAGNMAVHIKKTGLSYQLFRVDKYKETEDPKTKVKGQEIDQQTIYRIDLSWLNANSNFTKTEDETLAGYSNYYLENCPGGALNVKSYKGVTLHNLYRGIDLHYYEKNGELKHDYIVAVHADYKQIQLRVEGAEISLSKDGTLILITPLGKIQEGAPIVFQNGKQLKAKWLVRNTKRSQIVSFEIEDHDPNYELIIDPITRMWGTYYGGTSNTDHASSCATDVNNNIYITGGTASSSGTIIATSSSHQSQYGGSYSDAFLVKFDANGIRQWSTYYGGSLADGGASCVTDASGNVYMAGSTHSDTSSVIATTGSHQTNFGGGTHDAFLAKFNSSGIRQWSTYYGGTDYDGFASCAIDISGNIFIAGTTKSSGSISTLGSHQSTYMGTGILHDAFLVKFNPSGVRQWGTYYGGAPGDNGNSCSTDANGNVYLSGTTESYASTEIATAGSHQSLYGTNGDAFLVKFNANGTRLWGTYYGGSATDGGYSCATDVTGNVYLTGLTHSSSGTVIATPGSHQSTYIGGDAFLVKFDSSGIRQWGTYYGGTGSDYGMSCTADAVGNIFVAGYTSSGSGTAIATASSHQPAFGGGGNNDAFLVKFNPSGNRQSGTYYGGSGQEYGYSCVTDSRGDVYMAGFTTINSGTIIGSTGSHQSAYGGGNSDAYLVKFDVCDLAPSQPLAIIGATACAGFTITYSTTIVLGANSYTWSLPSGWLGSSNTNSISLTPGSSGVFTLIAGNACGVSSQQTLNVTVHNPPTVTVNNGTICSGQSFTFVPSGATTYSYSSGPIVSPYNTSTYSITGTNTFGCYNTVISTVTVHPSPTVIVSSGTICTGQSYTIVASGANSYSYSNGPVVSPSLTSFYSITGTSTAGCASSNTAILTVLVKQLPIVSISTTNTLLCVGESATLTADGALTYSFNPGGTGTNITISPIVTLTYVVTGTDNNGCENTATLIQNVDECLGIKNEKLKIKNAAVTIFPNPTKGIINVELDSENKVIIVNAIGQIVYSTELSSGTHQINLEGLAKGIYVLRVESGSDSKNIKIIKE